MYRHIVLGAVLAGVASADTDCAITWGAYTCDADTNMTTARADGTVDASGAETGSGAACSTFGCDDSTDGAACSETTHTPVACTACSVTSYNDATADSDGHTCTNGSQTETTNVVVAATNGGAACVDRVSDCVMPWVTGDFTIKGNFDEACTTDDYAATTPTVGCPTKAEFQTQVCTDLAAVALALAGDASYTMACDGSDFTLGTVTVTAPSRQLLEDSKGRKLADMTAATWSAPYTLYVNAGADAAARTASATALATAFAAHDFVEGNYDTAGTGFSAGAEGSATATAGTSPAAAGSSGFSARFGGQSMALTVFLSAVGFLMA